MGYIALSIISYLAFNLAIWLSIGDGGMIAMAMANFLGAGLTALFFRKELKGRVKWTVSMMGSFRDLAHRSGTPREP